MIKSRFEVLSLPACWAMLAAIIRTIIDQMLSPRLAIDLDISSGDMSAWTKFFFE